MLGAGFTAVIAVSCGIVGELGIIVEAGEREADAGSVGCLAGCLFFLGKAHVAAAREALVILNLIQLCDRGIDVVRCVAAGDALVGAAVVELVQVFDVPGGNVVQRIGATTYVCIGCVVAQEPLNIIRAGAAYRADVIWLGILE